MKPSNCIVTVLAAAVLVALTLSAVAASSGDRLRIAQVSIGNRVALVIGNANYPDDNKPLTQPIKDARSLAEELRRAGFDVTSGENLTSTRLRAALKSFISKIKPGSAALFFFSGYGIQTGKQSYIIPVDAQIWTEGEVKRDGITVESILNDMEAAGATVKVVIIDAARRNPFERRFRGFSSGLASLNAPAGTLAMYSAAPDKVINETDGENSLFVSELLKEMRSPGSSAETIFKNTRMGVSRASKNEQVPFVSSSLIEEFSFSKSPSGGPRQEVTETRKDEKQDRPREREEAAVQRQDSNTRKDEKQDRPREREEAAIQRQDSTDTRKDEKQDRPREREEAAIQRQDSDTRKDEKQDRPREREEAAIQRQDSTDTGKDERPERDKVIQGLDDQIRRNPRDADAFYRRGQAWAQRGQYGLASDDFGEAIRINPKDAESLNNRCFTRAVMGQLEGALSDCNEAIRLRGDYADALDSRGLTHLKLGQYDRAIADFDAAIRLNPRMPSALFGRGKAKLKKGDRSGGNADIRSAKSIDPAVDHDYENYGVR